MAGFYDSLTATGNVGLTNFSVGTYTPCVQKLLLQQKAITGLKVHTVSKRDILNIWSVVIPAVAGTLRPFALTGCKGGQPWGRSQTTSDARALLKCKKLEEVEVPFIQRNFLQVGGTVINSLPTLINEFVQNCPELYRIHTGNIATDFNVASSLVNFLMEFRSTDGMFRDRDIEIVLRHSTEGEWANLRSKTRFPRMGDEEDMVGVLIIIFIGGGGG